MQTINDTELLNFIQNLDSFKAKDLYAFLRSMSQEELNQLINAMKSLPKEYIEVLSKLADALPPKQTQEILEAIDQAQTPAWQSVLTSMTGSISMVCIVLTMSLITGGFANSTKRDINRLINQAFESFEENEETLDEPFHINEERNNAGEKIHKFTSMFSPKMGTNKDNNLKIHVKTFKAQTINNITNLPYAPQLQNRIAAIKDTNKNAHKILELLMLKGKEGTGKSYGAELLAKNTGRNTMLLTIDCGNLSDKEESLKKQIETLKLTIKKFEKEAKKNNATLVIFFDETDKRNEVFGPISNLVDEYFDKDKQGGYESERILILGTNEIPANDPNYKKIASRVPDANQIEFFAYNQDEVISAMRGKFEKQIATLIEGENSIQGDNTQGKEDYFNKTVFPKIEEQAKEAIKHKVTKNIDEILITFQGYKTSDPALNGLENYCAKLPQSYENKFIIDLIHDGKRVPGADLWNLAYIDQGIKAKFDEYLNNRGDNDKNTLIDYICKNGRFMNFRNTVNDSLMTKNQIQRIYDENKNNNNQKPDLQWYLNECQANIDAPNANIIHGDQNDLNSFKTTK